MSDDSDAGLRRNRSWLYDTTGGAVVRRSAIAVAVVLTATYVLFPLYWMVVTAFKTTAEIQRIPPTLFPLDVSIEGFQRVIASSVVASGYAPFVERTFGVTVTSDIDIDVFRLVVNSLTVSVGAAIIAVVAGTVAAYVVSQREFRGKSATMSVLLASLMFPGTAIMIPEWELISRLGLYNTRTALVLIYGAMTAPFVVWLMKGFFDDFPTSIVDAARMDQCTTYETFRYVVLPMSVNSLIASFIFSFLLAWNELVFALTLLSNEKFTVPPGLLTFVQGFNTQWNVVAAASILVSLPVLVGLAYIQRYFVQGLTGGAIKG